MKKFMYGAGTLALALVMSGLPAVALAERNGEEGGVQRAQESAREQQKQNEEIAREQQKQQLEMASSTRPSIKGGHEGEDLDLEENEAEDQASSSDDLMQKIGVRKHELDQEAASSTPEYRNIVENTNPVRLAVHSLLVARDLLDTHGGIGEQVSQIAKEVNHSVASTTEAEARIQARSFLARLLFGGDTTSAEVIAQEAAQNQARIDKLTALLGQAGISVDVQTALQEQITALKAAQARLQDLAQREKNAWGIFSWRF